MASSIDIPNAASLHLGDCREVMATMDADSIDAIVCDPPYGLEFMGKEFDRLGDGPGQQAWHHTWATQAVRVLKPGGHLLAFGGTRTHHRLTCALEDAGFEIRDCVMWVHSQGFPKSRDVSKAIDKAAGAARQWSGWGTALKPAVEYIVVAQKPLDLQGLCGVVARKIGESLCQLRSHAKDAANSSRSNPNGFVAVADSALWPAVPEFSTPEDLFAMMDTLRCAPEIPLTLSIALSWLDILGAIWIGANTFTTEMALSLTTDLRILNSWPSAIMLDSLIEAATGQLGIGSSASVVASIFNVAAVKLASTLTPSAPGLVTSPDAAPGLRPNWEPIIVARKPLAGTVAENVQRYGTGAINVDGCRIPGVWTSWRHCKRGFGSSGLTTINTTWTSRGGASKPRGASSAYSVKGKDKMNWLSYGGGVNSTALAVLLLSNRFPQYQPWRIVWADTLTERPETYDYIFRTFMPWLSRNGHTLEVVRGSEGVLERWERLGVTGSRVIRACTVEAKIKPIQRHIRGHGADGDVTLIGIDAGEEQRAVPPRDGRPVAYPLVEVDIDREDCVRILREAGLCVPHKSGCWCCPFMRKREVLDLARQSPERFQRIVALEARANQEHPHATQARTQWGNRTAEQWKRVAKDLGTQADIEDWAESALPCSCYDGE